MKLAMSRSFFRRIFLIGLLLAALMTNGYCHKRDSLNTNHLEFIANRGQWESQVLYKARLNSGALFAERDRLTLVMLDAQQANNFYEAKFNSQLSTDGHIDAAAYQMVFKNCQEARITGQKKEANHHNYFLGDDPSRWASQVPLFQELEYKNLYKDIDLLFYQQQHKLKYEFRLAPEANPQEIQIEYVGVNSLSLSNGNLLIKTDVGQITELAPYAYQLDEAGKTIEIPCKFILRKNTVSYELGHYNHSQPLIIDPQLIFSSYSGSSADNWGFTATYDKHGNLYGGGIAFGIGYPTQVGHHYQVDYAGGSCDVAISKFDSTGSQLFYSTYLGGNAAECPHSMFVNDNDELYVFGTTGSTDFPTSTHAYDRSFNGGSGITVNGQVAYTIGSDIFISKFSADGDSLLASTFLGGSSNDGLNTGSPLKKNYADESRGEIIVDEQSNVYVVSCTFSTDFPVTQGVFQPTHQGNKEGCIVKMDQNLSHLIWASFIGGNGDDACYSMDLADDYSIYLSGGTTTTTLPILGNVVQPTYGGGVCDGFVAHISENGDQLLQLTYLGKNDYDQGYLLKLSRNNHPYIFGQTTANGNVWMVNTLYGQAGGGQFITHLTPTLDSIVWSTVYGVGGGQGPDISPTALLVDLCNTVYMSGWGSHQLNGFGGTQGLPVTPDAFQLTTDGSDYYFICLREDGNTPVYATYFGSPNSREHVDGGTSRFDKKGKIYQAICAGCGGDDNFPTTPGAWSQTNESSNCNLGVVKMDFNLPLVIADFDAPTIVCYPDTVFFHNNSQTQSSFSQFHWDFGDVTSSNEISPAHLYTSGGLFHVTLTITDNSSCNLTDWTSKDILVLTGSSQTLEPKTICRGDFVQIGVPPAGDPNVHYQWTPEGSLSNPQLSNPIATPDSTTTYRLIISTPLCSDTIYQTVNVEELLITPLSDTTICLGDSYLAQFSILAGSPSHIVWSLHPDYSNPIAVNQQQITVQPTEDTPYYLLVEGNRCTIERSFTVYVSHVTINEPEPVRICFEDSIQLTIHATGGNSLQYSWQPISEISSGGDSPSPWINPSSSLTYTVVVTNEYGCSASASIPVTKRTGTFGQPLEAWCNECSIIEGTLTSLHATQYGSSYTYQWTPTAGLSSPTSPETTAMSSETTTYTVTVTDQFGCSLSKEVTIEVIPLTCDEPLVFVPNTFTPNGDGKNDILYVRSSILKDFNLRIYNRWGELIFETNRLDQGWDGSYKGKPCEQGVYDYYLTGTCVNDEKILKKGNISLIY
jgi:gliding motility-associated-like protein